DLRAEFITHDGFMRVVADRPLAARAEALQAMALLENPLAADDPPEISLVFQHGRCTAEAPESVSRAGNLLVVEGADNLAVAPSFCPHLKDSLNDGRFIRDLHQLLAIPGRPDFVAVRRAVRDEAGFGDSIQCPLTTIRKLPAEFLTHR